MPMPNYTFEDYKNAIKAKYEEEVRGGYSNNLNSPTPANLRNLCLKRFNTNTKKEDLIIFESFFEFAFDKDKRNLYGDLELNKLTSVQRFLLGKTETPTEDTVQFSAILVDFQPRPFFKFMEEFREENNEEEKEEELKKELRGTNFSNDLSEEKKYVDVKIEEPKNEVQEIFPSIPKLPIVNVPVKKRRTLSEIIYRRTKPVIIITTFIFSLIAAVIYFAFFQKHCMQWSEDHYEVVDCSPNESALNEIIPYDESLLDFKKLKACDTTTCFRKNGEAFVWYGKRGDEVDFFNNNGNGRHPETNGALRPVTSYMFGKYLKGKPCK
ncbi:hypothetical protein [Flavobacterium defluvii]|uniref:Uncharacterized protein n=1 Tax=Flavobacterium defluvii TaxID=370979 RepID=A0A1M5SXC7_9FLAO|nr:hypothetical protein [Flavobacterium defluvii]SHH42783.1 hypothetical protein SAMN05443663_107242 [Flavobacterium defluvii]